MKSWYRGVDCSSLEEVERCGGRFYDGGREGDCLEILRAYGADLLRLRLWNDPYSETGEPYGGGTSDLCSVIRLAGRGAALGMDLLLDLHYSDFWADPGKQTVPKAWRGLSDAQLEDAVYRYTYGVLQTMGERGLLPQMVAVGNEITGGLLWPIGKKPDDTVMTRLVSAGIRAVRDTDPAITAMLHLDSGGRNDVCREWFDSYRANGGEDFDCIGLSYYPFWHGTLDGLESNMNDLALRYGKPLIVAETSMGFSLEDYRPTEERASGRGMAANEAISRRVPFPMTPEGQAEFMQALTERIRAVPNGLGRGFIYWEPGWLPMPGTGWATRAGCAYIGEEGWGGNEWANQALFDYRGNALPALKTIRDFS